MKFLCTKVKKDWLTVQSHIEKLNTFGFDIKSPFIGIIIKDDKPSKEEYEKVENGINELFGNHKKAFPIRVIEFNYEESNI